MKLDYSGRVLSLLVEFMFTDQLASLDVDSDSGARKSCTLEETARLLTNLSGECRFHSVPLLTALPETQPATDLTRRPRRVRALFRHTQIGERHQGEADGLDVGSFLRGVRDSG